MKGLKRKLSSEEKSIHVIAFSGKKSDWNGRAKKFLARTEFQVDQKLFLCKKNKVGYNKLPPASLKMLKKN